MRPILNILFICVLAVLGMSGQAFAQKMTEQFKKEMPKIELMPAAEFKEKTTIFSEKFEEDSSLDFSIRLPKDWSESKVAGFGKIDVGQKMLTTLHKFYGPPVFAERSMVQIDAVKLDYAMTAEQWLVEYLLSHGYSLQGMHVDGRDKAEALYVFLDENNVSFVVRCVVAVNGKNVLFAQYFVPVERWKAERVMLTQALKSFKVLNPSDEFVEEMLDYEFLDLASFKYPASWALRSLPLRSVDRMRVEINNTSKVQRKSGNSRTRLDGQIDVELVSIYVAESLEEEIERFRQQMVEKGLVMGEVLENRYDFLLGEQFDFVDTQVFRVTDEDGRVIDHELWLTIMSAGEYYYFVTLFTPSRDKDYFKWARNSETYKLVVSLVSPKDAEL